MWLAAMGLMDGKVVRKRSWGVGCCARHWGALQPALPGKDLNSAAMPLTIICSHEGAMRLEAVTEDSAHCGIARGITDLTGNKQGPSLLCGGSRGTLLPKDPRTAKKAHLSGGGAGAAQHLDVQAVCGSQAVQLGQAARQGADKFAATLDAQHAVQVGAAQALQAGPHHCQQGICARWGLAGLQWQGPSEAQSLLRAVCNGDTCPLCAV